MRALVVGGGIAGLTAAVALRHAGWDVDLVEVRTAWGDDTGVGMAMQGNALRALDSIGLARGMIAAGAPCSRTAIHRADGTLISEQDAIPVGGPDFPANIGITRAAVHDVLAQGVRERGVSPRLGVTFERIDDRGDEVAVAFTDGSSGTYDLLVAADGIASDVRRLLFPTVEKQFTGLVAWRTPVRRPPDVNAVLVYFGGPQPVCGVCPTSADGAYIFAVEHRTTIERYDATGLLAGMNRMVDGYGGAIATIVRDAAFDPERIVCRPIEGLLVPAPWYRGRVVLIGDAAHACPPLLAQGAAMGIEDAVVLAEELHRVPHVPAALAAFMRRRFERARLVVENSMRMGELEIAPSPEITPTQLMVETLSQLAAPA